MSKHLRTLFGSLVHLLVRPGTRRRRAAGNTVRALRRVVNRLQGRPMGPPPPRYTRWLRGRTPSPAELEAQRVESRLWPLRPLISVCMPVHDPEPKWLDEAIESVRAQSYEAWELCICDDGSTSRAVREMLSTRAAQDPRIKVTARGRSGGISAATNAAMGLASGEFVAFLDHDDFIGPHTLYLVVRELQSDPGLDMFYCDEDLLLPFGKRVHPFLKPGWSPETLLSMNYITHFVVARRSVVEAVGGMRPERDGGQDHDLVLRISERTSAIHHIPEVLYTWRQSADSTSMTPDAKPWAFEASAEAVRDALARRAIPAAVERGSVPGLLRVRYELPEPPPHVEVLIPTRDRVELLSACIDSVRAHTNYPDYAITIVDNDSTDPSTLAYMGASGLRVVAAPGPFNYARIINEAIRRTDSEYILTLNNDTVVFDDDWMRGLVELCLRADVGAVGCRLVLPDGSVQHEGIVIGRRVPAANLVFNTPDIRIIGLLRSTREVSAVTGACCLTRRSAWERIGGLDEALAVAYNDVDYCLRLRRAGYRVIYTPHVTLVHDENSSRGALHPPEDERFFRERWQLDAEEVTDPFFSPRLVLGPWGWQLAPGRPEWLRRAADLQRAQGAGAER